MTTISGVTTVHARTEWEDPSNRITGPVPRGTAHTWVIHYPGGGSAPIGTAVAGYLRNIQADYVRSRGYSIGYSWGVAQDGSKWQIRGDDFNPASNPGRKVAGNFNDVSRSIFVMVANDDEASPAAIESINEIIATHPDWAVIVHGDVDYTSCAGVGLTGQVRSGVIGQTATPPTIPTIPTTTDEVDMIAIDYKPGTPEWTALTYTGSHLAHVVNGHADQVIRFANVQRVTVDDNQLDGLIRSAATTTACPSPWVNTARGAAWTAQRA